MKELSREASERVDLGREAFRPTEADQARVLAAVLSATPVVGAAAVLAASKTSVEGLAQVVWGTSVAKVLAVAVPVAAAGSLVWYATASDPASPSTARAPATPPGVSSPRALGPSPSDETSPLPEQPPPEPIAEQPTAAPPGRPSTSASEASSSGGQMREEVALLSRAQAELSRGRAQQALDALKEHAQRFPRGALRNERVATRARALCALGRTQEANAELDRMERLNPGSPYWARAREACRGK
jgi:hypothetical protein